MPVPLSTTRGHRFASVFGAMMLLMAVGLERGHARPVALVFGVLACVLLASRIVFRIEPRRGEARVLWTLAGMPGLALRRLRLSTVRAVEIGAETRTSESGSYRVYPVSLIGERDLRLWPVGDALAARRLGERIARALWVPLRDASNGGGAERAPEELHLNLGQRLRARHRTPASSSLPPRSAIRVRHGTETVLEFPAQPPPRWFLLFPFGIAAALGAGFWFFVPFPLSVFPLGFVLLLVAGFSYLFAAAHRSTSLALGPGGIRIRGQIGGARRIDLAHLEEILEGDGELKLVAGDARLGVPYRLEHGGERRFVVDLIERAAYDHPSARAPCPGPAGPPRANPGAPAHRPTPGPARARVPDERPSGRSTPTFLEHVATALHRPILPWFPGVFFILVGGAQMSFAGYVAHVDRAFAERAESTRGTVVGFARSGEALVRFRTARGEEITFRDTGGGRPPTRTVGESVEVLHDRWRPEDARVPGPFRTTVALGIALFGFTVSASGVRMLLRLRDE